MLFRRLTLWNERMALRCLPSPNVEKSSRMRLWKRLKLRPVAADQNSGCTGCGVLKPIPFACQTGVKAQGAASPQNGDIMDTHRAEALRKELGQLLRKQTEVLESRTFGAATDTDILEYEIRQEIIHEMCNQLANSDATV